MKKLICSVLLSIVWAHSQNLTTKLDSVYRYYALQQYSAAENLLQRLDAVSTRPADKFLVKLELADFFLDKKEDYAAAESLYRLILEQFPKDKRMPEILYRLALSQELQEKFLDAAKNYEQVATRYMKSAFGADALDAIERCFRKNYQDRVAYVDGFPITRIELDERISQNPAAYEKYEKKQELLNSMIDNRLQYQAAKSIGVFEDKHFRSSLNQIRNRLLYEEWYERNIVGRLDTSEKRLRAQYQKDKPTRYTTPEKVHGYQLVVADRRLADSLRKVLLAEPAKWDTLVRQFSIAPDKEKGGDMGFFARGVQPKAIEVAAFSLKPGQLSQPVKTEEGFALLKITERKPASTKPYAEVRDQILAQLRQAEGQKLYEKTVEMLKRKANVVMDTNALSQEKDTLAFVDNIPITRIDLEVRIQQIPIFFRSQFMTPEGRQRILEQLVLERIILREAEAQKLWLWNRVVHRLLEQRERLAIDRYRSLMISEKAQVDSAAIAAEYRATLKEHKVPAQVHAREIAAPTRERAQQLRAWAVAGRLPALIDGRGLFVTDQGQAAEIEQQLRTTTNTDSLIAVYSLTRAPALTGTPTLRVAGKEVANLTASCRAAGPYRGNAVFGLGFSNLSAEDKLYAPRLRQARTAEELVTLLGEKLQTDSTGKPIVDSAKLGAYLTLDRVLPADFVKRLVKLDTGEVARYELPDGVLLLKVTRKDSAQKVTFADLARRFSSAPSRWSSGDLYWLTRDDKSRDQKIINAAFSLDTGAVSPVMKLNDTTYTFIKVEEKKKAYTRPLEEVRPRLEDKLRQAAEEKLAAQLLADLRNRARIEILMKESDFIFELPAEEETQPQPEK